MGNCVLFSKLVLEREKDVLRCAVFKEHGTQENMRRVYMNTVVGRINIDSSTINIFTRKTFESIEKQSVDISKFWMNDGTPFS